MLQLSKNDLCKAVNDASAAPHSKTRIAETNFYIVYDAANMIRLYHKPGKEASDNYIKAGEIKLIIPFLSRQPAKMGSIQTEEAYRRLGIGHLLVTIGALTALKNKHEEIVVDETMINGSDVNFWNPIGIYKDINVNANIVLAAINEKMKTKAANINMTDFLDGSIIVDG